MREAVIPRRAAILPLLAVLAWACADGSTVNATTTGTGGHDAGATGGSGGTGGRAPLGDPLPQNAVSFFNAAACPNGWAPYDPAVGRFVVPTVGTTVGGAPYGVPLASGEDRAHSHDLSASFMLAATSFVGAAGGGNHGVAAAGAVLLTTTTDAVSAGLPYVQLLACKKLDPAVPRATPLPARMQMFFDAPVCPSGWKQVDVTQGRLLVGLPPGAPPDKPFGGPPLGASGFPTHTHAAAVQLVTTPHGIALASGCCADGYAADGTYTVMPDSDAAGVGVPYVELLSCEKT